MALTRPICPVLVFIAAIYNANYVQGIYNSACLASLKKYPSPDSTFTAKHLNSCSELCRNSTGHHPAGQFDHPWNCAAFINCFQEDAWVHYCPAGLVFNAVNQQCDWPYAVKCTSKDPSSIKLDIPSVSITVPQPPPVPTTCKEANPQFNIVEYLGDRPDLCTSGSGLYPAPDCRFYVRCNGTLAAVAKCPAGFVFDGANRGCNWPQKVPTCASICGDHTETHQPDPPAPATTQSPNILVQTVSSLPLIIPSTLVPTQPTTATTTTTTTTTTPKPTTTQPPHDPLCKNSTGSYEYPNDCRKYVKCINWHATLQDCPTGLVFVPEKGWCNWTWMLPENHKCYKPFDDGSGDCPFTRDSNDTQIAAPIAAKVGY